ncbi:MAG: GNAT family N-acetyltransferase [Acidiferrobacterales bacterium]|nr:GNAT family N-acetyltransferase [Acidiferrobacterales bacterium]
MNQQPSIQTHRLILRPFGLSDAQAVQLYAGDIRVAEMTENIPHPYEDGMAEDWIGSLPQKWRAGKQATFAICEKNSGGLIGCGGLVINSKHNRGELGYWVGVDHWGKGYCTEAAAAIVDYGFKELNLRRIQAQHLSINPASGAVMKKIGMNHEVTLSDYVLKEDYEDMELYFILNNSVNNDNSQA